MSARLELPQSDIEEELRRLARLEQEIVAVRDKLDLPPEQVPSYDRGAIGYLPRNCYSGCENIFRNAYVFELDWERERLVARRLEPAAAMLREQITAFLAQLDAIDPDSDDDASMLDGTGPL